MVVWADRDPTGGDDKVRGPQGRRQCFLGRLAVVVDGAEGAATISAPACRIRAGITTL